MMTTTTIHPLPCQSNFCIDHVFAKRKRRLIFDDEEDYPSRTTTPAAPPSFLKRNLKRKADK
jgi:hypothetical protein